MSIINKLLVILAATALAFIARPAFAQRPDAVIVNKPVPIVTEVVIPGTPIVVGGVDGQIVDLAQYIGIVYNFLIGIAGLVASVMLVVGGFQYLTSAGDSGKTGAAKKRMLNALVGLVLALGAYTILKTINPALLSLKLPGGIKGVETEMAFLPFCDKLAAQHGIPEEQIVRTGKLDSMAQGMGCGQAGFIKAQTTNADGTTLESRLWCAWRGSKAYGTARRQAGQAGSDYGCPDNTDIGGQQHFGTLSTRVLSICMLYGGITQAELNADYDKDQVVDTDLGRCLSCNQLDDDSNPRFGLPKGDIACQYWQNTANNGDPKDYDFKLSQKKILQDTRKSGFYGLVDASQRMYYCGYSANHERCIYVPVSCDLTSSCDSYDDAEMYYCEKEFDSNAQIDCRADQTLGSQWGTQMGNAAHLIPVCEGDPCEKGRNGCEVGGLAGMRNSVVGAAASKVRVVARVLTGGFTNSISCDAK